MNDETQVEDLAQMQAQADEAASIRLEVAEKAAKALLDVAAEQARLLSKYCFIWGNA